MKFYTQQHKHYCGIDLHARSMYVCILDQAGAVLVHQNVAATPEAFLRLIAPYRDDLVVAVEGMFTWYGLADLWAPEGECVYPRARPLYAGESRGQSQDR